MNTFDFPLVLRASVFGLGLAILTACGGGGRSNDDLAIVPPTNAPNPTPTMPGTPGGGENGGGDNGGGSDGGDGKCDGVETK